MFLRGELNVIIADSVGYFGVAGASCSLVGGLDILIAHILEYADSQGVSCPTIEIFYIAFLLYFDGLAISIFTSYGIQKK